MLLDIEERDRRYKLVREKMSEKELDALVVIGNAQFDQKGFIKYLSNYNLIFYFATVIFPLRGEPRFLVPSPLQKYWAGRLSWIKDVEIAPISGDGLVNSLEAMGLSQGRLGLINDKIMPAQAYSALEKNCPDATIVDATDILEEARMIKSAKEQELIRNAARIADLSFEILRQKLRPGAVEREVIADIDRELIANGSEYIFHLFSANTDNLYPLGPTDRVIEEGDVVLMNTELAGPEGYWVQIMRTCFIGTPKKNIERMYDVLLDIRSQVMNELYPGRIVSDIAKGIRKSIIDAGYDIGVHFGHSQGLDVVERPLLHVEEDTALASGMIMTVHPQLVSQKDHVTVIIGDTYLISDNGPELLTKTDPLAIKIIG